MFNSYERYGNPYKLVEFRMLVLNSCSMNCRGCFYERNKNNYNDFKFSLNFAKDLHKNNYKLETCYLLPTDIFDNKDNYKLFEDVYFVETISMFEYLGIASTLETGFDQEFFKMLKSKNSKTKIELQVNLLIEKLFDINYQTKIKSRIGKIKETYGNDIIINLAINTGFIFSDEEKLKLKKMINFLSDDNIVELNFTFLYNSKISKDKKKTMLIESIKTINDVSKYYYDENKNPKKYNDRTLFRKPAFTFLGNPNRIYLNPIIPFDEYVFIENEKYRISNSSFEEFINTYDGLNDINSVILDKCVDCENLNHCMGKGYFTISKEFDLGCFLDIR